MRQSPKKPTGRPEGSITKPQNWDERFRRQLLKMAESEGTKDSDRLKAIEIYSKFFRAQGHKAISLGLLEEKIRSERLRLVNLSSRMKKDKSTTTEEGGEIGKGEKGTIGDEEDRSVGGDGGREEKDVLEEKEERNVGR